MFPAPDPGDVASVVEHRLRITQPKVAGSTPAIVTISKSGTQLTRPLVLRGDQREGQAGPNGRRASSRRILDVKRPFTFGTPKAANPIPQEVCPCPMTTARIAVGQDTRLRIAPGPVCLLQEATSQLPAGFHPPVHPGGFFLSSGDEPQRSQRHPSTSAPGSTGR